MTSAALKLRQRGHAHGQRRQSRLLQRKSRDRIDGTVACAMAVSRASAAADSSIYDSEEWSAEMMLV